MILTMMKSKIHQATVTQCDLHYEGSITIADDLLKASGILPFEQVDVLNINNGVRFTTYAIQGEAGTGVIGVNGAAARLVQQGDPIIICSYARMDEAQARAHKPVILQMDEDNKIVNSNRLKDAA